MLLAGRHLGSQPVVAHADLLAEVRDAAGRFDRWLQPRSIDAVRIDDVPWYDPRAGTEVDGRLLVPRKWLASSRDRASSRALIAALSEPYWETGARDAGGVVSAGVREYLATRAIHEQLVSEHPFSIDLFGGFVTHAIRPVELSHIPRDPRPPVRRFPEVTHREDTARVVDAMFTLERYVGWAAVQSAVAEWQHSDDRSVQDLDESLWRRTARDLRWFTSAAFDATARYDFAVAAFTTTPHDSPPTTYETAVTVARLGGAAFPVDIEIVFADGTRTRERWDGREASRTFTYTSRSAATAAIVDPDLVLLLDDNRGNNSRVLTSPVHVPAIRWTMQWAIRLQDLLLTTAALM